MLKIWALATVFVLFSWNFTSAKTLKEDDTSHLNELEGSGYAESSPYPGRVNEYSSGYGSGDYDADSDEEEDPIDDEDEDELDNRISENDVDVAMNEESPVLNNEVLTNKNAPPRDDVDNRIALASTNNNSSVFASTEMLAAMIAGGTIGLLFAILLILLLVYRMRKKDEGSYDLSKKPIYKKAPTTEFYA